MIQYGEKYEADFTTLSGKTIRTTRRAVYRTEGEFTPKQDAAIKRVEEVIHKGKVNGDPYRTMREAELLGVELDEEFLVDGKWICRLSAALKILG